MKSFFILSLSVFAAGLAHAHEPIASGQVSLTLLTDADQRTLYTFDSDANGTSNCTGACAVTWTPVLLDPAHPSTNPEILPITRADGAAQLSFQGRPLYRYKNDLKPGDALGAELGGVWHVVVLGPALTPFSFEAVAGCQPNDYDYVDVEGDVTVTVTATKSYSPRCLRVKAGTKVTLPASGVHPLQGILNTTVANPFLNAGGAATAAQTATLTSPGFFGYFCTKHGTAQGTGMAGAIQVVP